MKPHDTHQPPNTSHRVGTPRVTWACLCLAASLATGAMGTTGVAHASTLQEKVVCTDAPRSQWLTEEQARKLFKASEYALVKFKVSKGNCHEFYAVDHQGGVTEAYVHPVTGAHVRLTRIPAATPPVSNPSGVRP